MDVKKIMLTCLLCLVSFGRSAGAEVSGDVLLAPVSARAIALAGAYTGLADDVYAMLHNPAGLAQMARYQVAFNHVAGWFDTLEYFTVAGPLEDGQGTIGASLTYRGMPDIDNAGAVDSAIRSQDMVGVLSYALNLRAFSRSLQAWDVGINLKWLRSTLGDYSPSALAADLGVLWRSPKLPDLQIGAAVQHLGTKLKYIQAEHDLPLRVKIGATYNIYNIMNQEIHSLFVSVDGQYGLYEEHYSVAAGAEYGWREIIYLRVGYQYQPDSLASVVYSGLGVQLQVDQISLRLDYAFKPVLAASDSFEAEHVIGLVVGF